MHRRRDQPHRVGRRSARPYTSAFGADIWDDWKRSDVAQVRAADRGGRAARAHQRAPPDVRRAVAARRRCRGRSSSATGRWSIQRENNDQAPAYVRLDPATGARKNCWRRTAAGPPRRRPTDAGSCSSASTSFPLGWRISGNAHLSWNDLYLFDLERRSVRPLTRGPARTSPTSRPTARRSRASSATTGGRASSRSFRSAAARRACWRRTRPGSRTRRRSRPTDA